MLKTAEIRCSTAAGEARFCNGVEPFNEPVDSSLSPRQRIDNQQGMPGQADTPSGGLHSTGVGGEEEPCDQRMQLHPLTSATTKVPFFCQTIHEQYRQGRGVW